MRPGPVLLAALLVAAPGTGVTFLLFPPGRASLATRLGLVVPFGFAGVGVVALALAIAHALTTVALAVVLAIGTVAAWAAALRRDGWRRHLPALGRDVRAEPWAYGSWFGLAAAFVAVRLTYSPVLNLADQTPLRYWADGLEIADAHHIPALSLQWGRLYPTAVSKVVLNAFDAAGALVLGRGPLIPMGALLVVGSVGLFLVAFALARELGLRVTAPFVAVLLFANATLGPRDLTNDLTNFRAETWGRLVVLAALLMTVRAMARASPEPAAAGEAPPGAAATEHAPAEPAVARPGGPWRRGEAVVAGVLFGLAAGTHLVPTVVGLAFAGGYALSRLLRRGRGRVRAVLVPAATILGVAVASAALVRFASGGDLGFGGAANTASYRALARDLGLPRDFDPTLYLALGRTASPPARGFYQPPSVTYHELVRRMVGERRLRRPFLVAVPVLGALGLVALWRRSDREPDLWDAGVASVLTALAILGVALAFSHRFHVYVFAVFGARRLFDYAGLAAVLMAAAMVELGLRRLPTRRSGRAPGVPVAAAVALAVLAAIALPRVVAPSARERFYGSALAPLAWIERNVPCRGRVLADRRTLATFESLARRAGALEGMGPYLRPELLETAIADLFAARAFFRDPVAHGGDLRRWGIAAVVVTARDQTLGGVGGTLKVGGPRSPLARVPGLRIAARSSTVTVYRVTGFDPAAAGRFPDVSSRPGYRCGAEPSG
jgi:hypothetical protein